MDQFAIKRLVRRLVPQTEFEELDFLSQTNKVPAEALSGTLAAVANDLQQELKLIANDEFESFVKLFNDIGDIGAEEFGKFENKIACLRHRTMVQCQRSPSICPS